MSIAIEIDGVKQVLLSDGWHIVGENEEGDSTFALDAYEYLWGEQVVHGGGSSGVCSTGFVFFDDSTQNWVAGPLTAVLAVRYA
jgi:hypothetical protein